MPTPRVGCFTLSGLTAVSTSGYTGCIGSREGIIPMSKEKSTAAVECVAAGLHKTLVAEFQSPMGSVEMECEWTGEDFNRIALATPSGKLFVVVTSVVGEGGADVRVVVLDSETLDCGDLLPKVYVRELGRVARAVAAISGVDSVWPDPEWSRTFLASVDSEVADS